MPARSAPGPASARPSRAAARPNRLLVAIPALDEAATLGAVLDAIPRRIDGIDEIAVLVVDDASHDTTAEIARTRDATVIRHLENRGVGAAFHTALGHALETGADFLITLDADGQFDPRDIPAVVAPVVRDEADFVTGSRFAEPALAPRMPWLKRWGNRQMSRLVSHLTGRRFHDVSCGMRCYNRRALLSLNLMGAFTYTQEVFLNLAYKRLRIAEVPIRVRGQREFGTSRVAANVPRYALLTSAILLRAYRDHHPMRFFGSLAALLLAPALTLEAFFVTHYLVFGSFSPHKWAGFSGAALALLGLGMVCMGVLGDLLNRHRIYLEELLYENRRRNGEHGAGALPRG